jgi:hypothetical protein
VAKRTTAPPNRLAPPVPWSRYANGAWWRLEPGEDFHQPARLAARAARQWALKNGMRCSAYRLDDGAIQVQFTKVES